MRTSDFSYDLPPELIAQRPAACRDHSRLLCLQRATGSASHRVFSELTSLLRDGDRLVINDTRVRPARVYCRRDSGGRVEVLFLAPRADGSWTALVRPGRSMRAGSEAGVEGCPQDRLKVDEVLPDGERVISIIDKSLHDSIETVMETHGLPPLPPYVARPAEPGDRERYQTVYAREPGAVAAPTAGLHFTPALMESLEASGIAISRLTLHVGLGTFKPVTEEDPLRHEIHTEWFHLPDATVRDIVQTKQDGGRVVAVGTTSVRVLEYCWRGGSPRGAQRGNCDLYILPGFEFRVVDALITNFHLPRSTLLMLVSAFAGRERVLRAYQEAVEKRYRFYSYGDAMFIY